MDSGRQVLTIDNVPVTTTTTEMTTQEVEYDDYDEVTVQGNVSVKTSSADRVPTHTAASVLVILLAIACLVNWDDWRQRQQFTDISPHSYSNTVQNQGLPETFWKWLQQFSYKVNLIFQPWCLWTFLQIFKRVTIIWLILHSTTSNIHPMWIFMYYCFLVLFKYTNSGILEMRLVYTVNRLLICLNNSYKCWFPNLFIWGGHNYSFDLIVLWQMDNGQHIIGIIFTSTPSTNVSKLVWCVHLPSCFPHEVFNGQK